MLKMSHITQSDFKQKWNYFLAQFRYWAYNSGRKYLIRKHILEQYRWRLIKMDPQCYINGECKICSCNTTQLQFSNLACEKPCYPAMMTKGVWLNYKREKNIILNPEP